MSNTIAGVYATTAIEANPSTGTLKANKYNITSAVTMEYSTDYQALKFVFN